MKITDVRVRRIAQSGKMKAIVSITFDNEFVVHDIKPELFIPIGTTRLKAA